MDHGLELSDQSLQALREVHGFMKATLVQDTDQAVFKEINDKQLL